jgi:hypothetical protein
MRFCSVVREYRHVEAADDFLHSCIVARCCEVGGVLYSEDSSSLFGNFFGRSTKADGELMSPTGRENGGSRSESPRARNVLAGDREQSSSHQEVVLWHERKNASRKVFCTRNADRQPRQCPEYHLSDVVSGTLLQLDQPPTPRLWI